MIQWSTFRSQIRRSILKDNAESKWDNNQLLDMLGWALNHFCAHTAMPSSMVSTIETATTAITLPDNQYDKVDSTIIVRLNKDEAYEWLEPLRLTPGTYWPEDTPDANSTPRAYWEWPTGTLNFGFQLEATDVVTVFYYAYYNVPTEDTDYINIPKWAELALAYLVGAYATLPEGMSATNIRRWADKQESGNPEHNPLHRQAEHLLRLYREEIALHPPQNRTNFFTPGHEL